MSTILVWLWVKFSIPKNPIPITVLSSFRKFPHNLKEGHKNLLGTQWSHTMCNTHNLLNFDSFPGKFLPVKENIGVDVKC